jgi:hypothetical protein
MGVWPPKPQKVSDTKMFWKTKEFGRDFKKPTFASSSPLTPATQSGLREQRITPRGVKPANKAERSAAEPVKRAIPGVNRDFPPGQAL